MHALFFLLSCSNDKSTDSSVEAGWKPQLVCPGDIGCESLGDGGLQAGASAKTITPICFEKWDDLNQDNVYKASQDVFFDCGCDQLCPGDEGYTEPDQGEADGEFHAVWLAGFNNSRPANDVHDDLWSRTIVVEQGDVTLAIVSLDLVGYFNDDIELIRQRLVTEGVEIDHILISSTHVHSGPDVLGQWGKQIGVTGRDDDYLQYLQDRIVESIVEAKQNLTSVQMKINSIDVTSYSEEKGSRNIIHDHRDPKIIDPMLNVAVFENSSGEVVASLLNFGNHPEVLNGNSLSITSDFIDATRRGVEDGIIYPDYEVEGIGGVCVYISASVGGMMSPLNIEVTDGSGQSYSVSSFEKSDALGNVMAELALQSIEEAVPMEQPDLAIYKHTFDIAVENVLFQAAFVSGMFVREIENYESGEMLENGKDPLVKTEINIIDIGSLRMQTIPGELLPELAIGGFDPADGQPLTDLEVIINEDNPNPPDLSAAPQGPFLKQRMGAEYNWIIGLGNDELGYFIPSYNYKLDERAPYLREAEGDHYEETNSLGPSAYPLLEEQIDLLLEWVTEQ
jgi:hypothetical protein